MKDRKIPGVLLFFLMAVLANFQFSELCAQNAPVTTLSMVGNVLPGQVSVPITVTGFNNIGACSLSFDYQYAGLNFLQGIPNPLLPGFSIGDQDLGNGKHRVTLGWFGNGTTLPGGSVIMTVSFNFTGGITDLEFFDNGPSCEYADGNFNILNDIPQDQYYINGSVCGIIVNAGPVSGLSSVCQGQTGAGYSVSPVANATSYTWTVPAGATIVSGNNTNAVIVDFSLAAVSGNILVSGMNVCAIGPSSQLALTINPLPIANAGPDFSIPYGTNTTLNASSGGAGLFNYLWSPESLLVNPNLQNPQTVNLTATTVFTLSVTNQASLCKNSDEVVVSITGGPLSASPIAIPGTICRGTHSQLMANAGGGSGNYACTWTCIPPGNPPFVSYMANPVVFPDSSKVYHLTVSDGFNSVQASVPLVVNQLPTATISGGDTLCGTGNSTILTVDLTGTPPWDFYYSNGVTTWQVLAQFNTPFSIITAEPGVYNILSVNDAFCSGISAGAAIVAVSPIPPTPVISVNGSKLVSTACCGNQWFKEGVPIPGATLQIYEPEQSGHYTDRITVDGCQSGLSNVIYYFMTGTESQKSGKYIVEPNPARGYVRISRGIQGSTPTLVEIYTITGTLKYTAPIGANFESGCMSLDIQKLTPGFYLIVIKTSAEKTVLPLVVY